MAPITHLPDDDSGRAVLPHQQRAPHLLQPVLVPCADMLDEPPLSEFRVGALAGLRPAPARHLVLLDRLVAHLPAFFRLALTSITAGGSAAIWRSTSSKILAKAYLFS